VRTVRQECLAWRLLVGGWRLERVLRVYVEHDYRHRPHRALALAQPEPFTEVPVVGGLWVPEVCRRDRLGGLLCEYHRAA